jgi:cytochrome b6-f complex iron-sulfur subunit
VDRKEFLSMVGIGAAALACNYCFSGCSNNGSDSPTAPTNVDFTLDLADPANAALNNAGGSVYHSGIVIAHTNSGSYIAVSQACTHQGATVVYDASTNRFSCPVHGSVFAADGSVVRGPAGNSLGRYTTSLSGSTLRVSS